MTTIEEIAYKLDNTSTIIYLGKNVELRGNTEHSIMLVTHEFSRSGAPIMLLELGKSFLKRGFSVWTVCDLENAFKEEFIEAGINVVIYPDYKNDDLWLKKLSKTFDLWCLNTLVLRDFFKKINNSHEKVIWWIHENEYIFDYLEKELQLINPSINSKVLAAGPYVRQSIEKYMKINAKILNFPIKDDGINKRTPNSSDKIRFIQLGYISRLKGQGILVDAIELLDENIRNQCEFIFCANITPSDTEILLKVNNATFKYDNVSMIPAVDRETLYKMYNDIDVVVVASKKEATSAVMVEAMMKGMIGICSDGCGITHYIKDSKSGFIFESGVADELAKKITYVVNNINELNEIKINARKVYEQVYTPEIFEHNIDIIINWVFSN